MCRRCVLVFALLAAMAAYHSLNPVRAAGQTPRAADGQPDLQGLWTNSTTTPLERPPDMADRAVLTAEEVAALAVYLAADESAFTSGAVHVIDGVMSA